MSSSDRAAEERTVDTYVMWDTFILKHGFKKLEKRGNQVYTVAMTVTNFQIVIRTNLIKNGWYRKKCNRNNGNFILIYKK